MSSSYREDAVRRGSDMRDKAMAMAKKRKEEYLGARVPKALKERVIAKAEEMGIPVSLLMRRLLEQSFPENGSSVAGINEDDFSVSSSQAAKAAIKPDVAESRQVKPAAEKYTDIIGWKSIEVNQDRSCERCREPLPKGMEASLAFTASDTGYVIVCVQCKTQLCES